MSGESKSGNEKSSFGITGVLAPYEKTDEREEIKDDINKIRRKLEGKKSYIRQLDRDAEKYQNISNLHRWNRDMLEFYGITETYFNKSKKSVIQRRILDFISKRREKFEGEKKKLSDDLNNLYVRENPAEPTPSIRTQEINSIRRERDILENNYLQYPFSTVTTLDDFKTGDRGAGWNVLKEIIREIKQGAYRNFSHGDSRCEDTLREKFEEILASRNKLPKGFFNRRSTLDNIRKDEFDLYASALIEYCLRELYGNIVEIFELTQTSLHYIDIYESDMYRNFPMSSKKAYYQDIIKFITESRLSIGFFKTKSEKRLETDRKSQVKKLRMQPIENQKRELFYLSQFLIDNCVQKFLKTQDPNKIKIIMQISSIAYRGLNSKNRGMNSKARSSTVQISVSNIWTIIENASLKLYDIEKEIRKDIEAVIKIQALQRGRRARKAEPVPPEYPSSEEDVDPKIREAFKSFNEDAEQALAIAAAAEAADQKQKEGRPHRARKLLDLFRSRRRRKKKGGTRKKRKFKKTRRKSNGYKKKTKRKKRRKKKQKKTRRK